MRKILVCATLAALAACNSPETAEPAPVETTAVVAPPVEPTMPPPDEAAFAAAYAEGCPGALAVSTSLCKSKGMGEEGFLCDYGLGKDEYRRNKAELLPGDGKWVLAEPEKICAADAA